MSRWKSPQAAAKDAERAAKKAEKLRKEKRRSVLTIIGVAIVSLGLCVADYFWLRYQARQRREQHERLYHHKQSTNNPTLQTNQTGVSLPERKP